MARLLTRLFVGCLDALGSWWLEEGWQRLDLEPGASVLSGVEVGLQSGGAALATANAGVY